MQGFQVGDYVIADRAIYDRFDGTFKITGFVRNALGQMTCRVTNITDETRSTLFYPHELSFEDGSRPEGR